MFFFYLDGGWPVPDEFRSFVLEVEGGGEGGGGWREGRSGGRGWGCGRWKREVSQLRRSKTRVWGKSDTYVARSGKESPSTPNTQLKAPGLRTRTGLR